VSIRAEGSKPGQGEESVGALSIGDEVLCRVKRLNPRYASCDISCKGNSPLIKEFLGIIRVQDVRATEIDKVSEGAGRSAFASAAQALASIDRFVDSVLN